MPKKFGFPRNEASRRDKILQHEIVTQWGRDHKTRNDIIDNNPFPVSYNLLVAPEAFNTTSVWVPASDGFATANTDANPLNGGVDADTLVDSNAAGFSALRQSLTPPTVHDDEHYIFSVFLKKTSGAASFPLINLNVNNTGGDYGAVIDTNNGNAADWQSSVGSIGFGTEDYGDYWRAYVIGQNNNSGDVLRCDIFPAINSVANGTHLDSHVGDVVGWGAQLHVGTISLRYIQQD